MKNREVEVVPQGAKLSRSRVILGCVVVLTLLACASLPTISATGQLVAHNTPNFVATAKNLGAEDPTKVIEVSIWLNPHNRSELDELATQLYDPSSSNYQHWLKRSDLSRFAPTAAEAKTVKAFFQSHGLKIVTVGPDNFFVRARGTVGQVETAFQVKLNNYQVRDEVIRANDRNPYVDGAAAPLVRAVSGLDTGKYEHPAMARPTTLPSVKDAVSRAITPATITPADFFDTNCFNGLETETFSTNNNGTLPIGTYSGNHLNIQSLTSAGCAYTPPPIQAAYNLNGLYEEGYDGTGQTIAIIDWCGSLTIQADANAFSAMFGLPALTSSNFNIIYTPAPSLCESADQVEINIDVEWAHAVAPGANINLIVPPTSFFQDIDQAEFTTIYNGLGNVISGSYGAIEAFVPETELETGNLLSELASVFGISANFSTGDTGDFTTYGIPATVLYPADSPWSTGVGGVTLALNPDNSIAWQAGWGNNQTLLAESGFIEDPADFGAFGFIGGSGGGASNCASQDEFGDCLAGFPKPSFQKKVPGKYRQLPDISWLADPYTGVAILISIPGQVPEQVWQVWGGTSVACPMFSGLWAIANQESQQNGGPALGQAASHVYSLPAGTIFDVVPVGSKTNVTASVLDSGGKTFSNPNQLLGGASPAKFVSAIWDYPFYQDTALVISFGTDCAAVSPSLYFDGTPCNVASALHTKVGWDNVTGVGTPNAQAFADSFNPANADVK
jgi:subtilase family serine protease